VEYPVNAPTFTTTVPVTPGNITIVDVPTPSAQSWPLGVVANNAVHAFAPDEFVCYLINRDIFTSDAALGLPVDTMDTEFIVMTYEGAYHGSDRGEFVIVAGFDGTTVTITPAQDLAGGYLAGVPFNVALNRGEGFLCQSLGAILSAADLTGSVITSDRPITVTNGNYCTNVPYNVTACDHVFEVAHPVSTWGRRALVANLPDRPNGTVYRVLASVDGTNVLLDGAPLISLNRAQFLEVPQTSGNHVFEADQPIMVVQFMPSLDNPGATTGDPAMGNMIPTEQYVEQYTFSTAGGGQFAAHFLTVIADDADLATIELDGAAIGAGNFSPVGATGFSAAVLSLPEGTHSTSSVHGHGITVEGYNAYDSYLYPGGALFRNVDCTGTVVAYGTPYPGTGGIAPSLGVTGCPRIGGSVTLDVTQGVGEAHACIVIGLNGRANAHLAGGTLWVAPPFATVLVFDLGGPNGLAGAGSASVPFDIPNKQALVGLTVNLQGGIIDPGATFGVSLTNGVEVTIGDIQ